MSFLPRIYADPALYETFMTNGIGILSTENAHYLGNVLRLGEGDKVALFNERDGEWLCNIKSLKRGKGSVILQQQTRKPLIPHGPTLVFSPLKRDATDIAVRMATEMGVRVLQPVIMKRTNSQRIKEERLRSITIEAAEQCDRLTLPEIRPLITLDQFLESWEKDRVLLTAIERWDTRHISVKDSQNFSGNEGILVGPEGGFDDCEIKTFLRCDFVQPLPLGMLTLRAETAIAAGLAQLLNHIQA